MDKHILTSKTFGANVAVIVTALVSIFGSNLGVNDQTAAVGIILAILNIVLRAVTKEPVRLV
jgi:hypothetical protein